MEIKAFFCRVTETLAEKCPAQKLNESGARASKRLGRIWAFIWMQMR